MEHLERAPFIGDRFPTVTVKTTKGMINLPDDYLGKWFVLFSHPSDFTPVCTTEFVTFAANYPQYQQLNTELIGLSVDQVFSHLKWLEWIEKNIGIKIPFPVIADDLGNLAKHLGILHPEHGTNTVRSIFIVDDKGIIRLILTYPPEVGRNMDEILRALYALQIATQNQVALPANWPNNSLIGNQVILPPAQSEEMIKSRIEQMNKGEVQCFDWWLCFKKLDS
jgi:peroxiredoxin 2/4